MHHWFILFWAPDPHSQLPTGHCPLDDHRHLEVTIYESEFTFIYWNESPTLCYLVLLFLVNVLGWSLTSSQDITLLPPTWKPDDKNLLVLLPFNIASTSAALQDLISLYCWTNLKKSLYLCLSLFYLIFKTPSMWFFTLWLKIPPRFPTLQENGILLRFCII